MTMTTPPSCALVTVNASVGDVVTRLNGEWMVGLGGTEEITRLLDRGRKRPVLLFLTKCFDPVRSPRTHKRCNLLWQCPVVRFHHFSYQVPRYWSTLSARRPDWNYSGRWCRC